MWLDVVVRDEYPHEWKSQRSAGSSWRLSIADMDTTPGAMRCTNNFAYDLTPEEVDKYKGKLRDRTIRVGVRSIKTDFSGTLVMAGQILVVHGPDGKGQK